MAQIKFFLITLILLTGYFVLPVGPAFASAQRFIPLPPANRLQASKPLISPAPKFFPLPQARYGTPSQAPANTLPSASLNGKANMSPEQAQQLLSIFSGNK